MTNPDNLLAHTVDMEQEQAVNKREQRVVEAVKTAVEDVLRNEFGGDGATLKAREFKGKLSVYPNLVDSGVNHESLYSMCGLNLDIKQLLQKRGFTCENKQSARKDGNAHGYAIVRKDGIEVIIDGAIGQFILGYNHTFVGTREALRNLVVTQTGDGKPYKIVNTRSHNNPPEAFERIWGNTSNDIN